MCVIGVDECKARPRSYDGVRDTDSQYGSSVHRVNTDDDSVVDGGDNSAVSMVGRKGSPRAGDTVEAQVCDCLPGVAPIAINHIVYCDMCVCDCSGHLMMNPMSVKLRQRLGEEEMLGGFLDLLLIICPNL